MFFKSIKIVSLAIVTIMVISILSILMMFDLNTEDIQIKKTDLAIVNYNSQSSEKVNLGSLDSNIDNESNVKPYKGYNDAVQRAMAKELLQLYSEVVQKQATLIQQGVKEEDLIKVLLGTHVAETGTYHASNPIGYIDFVSNTDKGSPYQAHYDTLIPSTMILWEDYGKQVGGKTINFHNYGWKDFMSKHGIDNPSNQNPGSQGNNLKFYSGFNYYLRSFTGALNSLQYQPTSWNSNEFVIGSRSGNNPDWITDIQRYVETAPIRGGAVDFNGDNIYDIYNLGDLALAKLNWFASEFIKDSIDPTKNKNGINLNDVGLLQVWSSFAYLNGNYNLLKANAEVYNADISKIINDKNLLNKLKIYYDNACGHGTGDRDLILEAYEALGWVISNDKKTISKENFILTLNSAVYPLRTYFEGQCWYEFMIGVSQGKNDNTSLLLGRNQVRYNYMTESNPKRNTNQNIRADSIDKRMAIGYKGNIPIYDQGGNFMKQYRMIYPNGTWTQFYHVACTIFAITSMHFSTGNDLTPVNSTSMDINSGPGGAIGYIDPVEYWGMGRHFANNGLKAYTPQQLREFPTDYIGTVLVSNILLNSGYKLNKTCQGTPEGNESIMNRLKNAVPVNIRTAGTPISAVVPKIAQSEINYYVHDMHNLNDYDITKTVKVYLGTPEVEHSVLGVDAMLINGKWYISIVNSVQSHSSGWDTNIVWLDADELLSYYYTEGFSIVGSVDPNWKPVYLSNSFTPSVSTGNTAFKGVDPAVVLDSFTNSVLDVENAYTMSIIPKNENYIGLTLPESEIKLKKISNNTLRIYAGESAGIIYALDISNILINDNLKLNELFKINSGEKAEIKKLSFLKDKEINITYETFFDYME